MSAAELAEIKAAIGAAEKRTSGEIRVFIEDSAEDGPLDRAAFLFNKLGMDKTNLRNGVLIYVAFVDHKFCIIGDSGINQKVGATFWNAIKEKMIGHFKENRIAQGLLEAIVDSGEALAKYFPYAAADRNELPDDIMFGDGKK
ncbi:MAG: TPM domain-containing protein [Bacteroidetes bacterium]|nr:TPM domain-containing protein [Bacteroidota bacterium]